MKPKIANAVILIVLLNEAKKTQMIFMRKNKMEQKNLHYFISSIFIKQHQII